MSYLALARKWRPRTFKELLGQEQLTTALIHSLEQQRVHHAYLFTGTRGVGKTSVARLLAKALNCAQGISATPCLQCDACVSIEQGRFVDLIEIDAASKTRVEDTRDVLENVQYAPTLGRYKIYLIDEVHMLSQHSFNALLKTLEEPPAHVKFLLATTDPQKIPVTVLSRCLQFNLRHVDEAVIANHLQYVLQQESIQSEPEALALLAKVAAGSMRDALSLLDQSIATCGEKLQLQPIKALLGFTQQDYAIQILQALSHNKPEQLLTISQDIYQNGGHFIYVLDALLGHLHHIAMYQALDNPSPLLKLTDELVALSTRISREEVQLMYQIALKSKEDISYAPSLLVGFEMTLLRMHAFIPAAEQSTTIPASQAEPEPEPVTIQVAIEQSSIQIEPPLSILPESEPVAILSPNREDAPWMEIFPQLNLKGLARTAAENAQLSSHRDNIIGLQVEKKHESLFTKPVITRLEESLSQYFGEAKRVHLAFSTHGVVSPAVQKKEQEAAARQEANAQLEQDIFFKKLQTEFAGEVINDSVKLNVAGFSEPNDL